jgi:hypothetical protein
VDTAGVGADRGREAGEGGREDPLAVQPAEGTGAVPDRSLPVPELPMPLLTPSISTVPDLPSLCR